MQGDVPLGISIPPSVHDTLNSATSPVAAAEANHGVGVVPHATDLRTTSGYCEGVALLTMTALVFLSGAFIPMFACTDLEYTMANQDSLRLSHAQKSIPVSIDFYCSGVQCYQGTQRRLPITKAPLDQSSAAFALISGIFSCAGSLISVARIGLLFSPNTDHHVIGCRWAFTASFFSFFSGVGALMALRSKDVVLFISIFLLFVPAIIYLPLGWERLRQTKQQSKGVQSHMKQGSSSHSKSAKRPPSTRVERRAFVPPATQHRASTQRSEQAEFEALYGVPPVRGIGTNTFLPPPTFTNPVRGSRGVAQTLVDAGPEGSDGALTE